ncbi:MAG: AsmA family protein, partial [Saprospiraceae bacterium]
TRWRKFLRILLITIGSLLVLVAAAIYALTLPSVQQKITRKAESFLQDKLQTRVEIGAIRLRFPYNVSLEKFLLEDQQGDTLARVGSLVISMDMWKLLDHTIELQKITLEDASVYLHQKDSIYNFDFVTKAFANPDTMAVKPVDSTASAWNLRLNLAVLQLKSVDFLLQDEDSQSITQAKIGTAETTIQKADLKTLHFELDGFALADSEIRMIQKKKSVNAKPTPAFGLTLKDGDITNSNIVYSTPERALDATLSKTKLGNLQLESANDVMGIVAKDIRVENSALAYRDPANPVTPGHFNASDMALTALNADLPDFSMQGDSIYVEANALSGNDKSGLQLHSLKTTARVTTGSIEIRNL